MVVGSIIFKCKVAIYTVHNMNSINSIINNIINYKLKIIINDIIMFWEGYPLLLSVTGREEARMYIT